MIPSVGCARFPEFVQNFSEHQILWSLCSADFYIAFAYSNSTFCGAWTPSFCEFTWKLSNIVAKRAHPWSQHFGSFRFHRTKAWIYTLYGPSLTEYTNRQWIILILFYVDAQPPYVSTVTWNEQYGKPILFQLLIFTARKRSLGQGNMFTGVCLSTGGCLSREGAWSQGGCLVPGVGLLRGGLIPGACLVATPPTATAEGGTHPTGIHSCVTMITWLILQWMDCDWSMISIPVM